MPTVEDFERRFLERARLQSMPAPEAVLAGRETALPATGGPFVGGWWCRPGTDPRLSLLPNPWDDRDAIALYDEHAWEVTRPLLSGLSRALDELHGVSRPPVYWDLLLVQWLHTLVTTTIDRLLFLDTVERLFGDVPLLGAPGGLRTPTTLAEACDEQLGEHWNVAFLRALWERRGGRLQDAATDRPTPAAPARRNLVAALDLAPQLVARELVARWLGRLPGRRIALLGAGSVGSRQLLALARDVPGLRVAPRRGARSAIAARPLRSERDTLSEIDGPPALVALLPVLVPQTALEAHGDLIAASERSCGPACAALHRNYAWDDVENEFLARCAAAGRPVTFGQHGGATFQLAVAPIESHMRRNGRRYISWGAKDDNVVPAADPYVQRLRDTHRGGTSVLLVESVTPPYSYVYRFTSTPLGNQVFSEEERTACFVDAVRRSREHLLLKGFPGAEAAAARRAELRALPLADRQRRYRPAPHWMRRARLVVCTYADTPFIEAMAIGVPVLGLWDTGLWQMRADAARHFGDLERLGVVHRDPTRCAAKLDEVYDEAGEWWSSSEIQAARAAFLERFAAFGDWRRQWAGALHSLMSTS